MLPVQLLLLVLNGQVWHAGRIPGTGHALGPVRACTRKYFVLPLQQNLGRPTDDGCCVSAYLLLERFFPLGIDDLDVGVVLVVLFVLWTVLVVMWLDFMELIDIGRLNRRSLLPMIRFSVRYCLGYFCVLSQVCFRLGLV